MNNHGEPVWFDGEYLIDSNGQPLDPDGMERAAKCMNAMVDVENPDAVAGLVDAVNCYFYEDGCDLDYEDRHDRVMDALSALKNGGEEG